MKIKNSVICQNCSTENEYFKETCKNCKSYLRARIVNIDLWRTIWYLIESPLKAFKEIIFAEHKNYIIFILIIMGVKYFLNSLIISNFLFHHDSVNETSFGQVLPAGAALILLVFLLSFIFTHIMNAMGYRNNKKSVFAVLAYTFMPSIMIFAILSPIEFALFGQHWFYHNPSPLALKQNAAIILLGIEVLVYIWGCFLSIKGFYALTGKKLLSYLFGFIFSLIITAVMILLPFIY